MKNLESLDDFVHQPEGTGYVSTSLGMLLGTAMAIDSHRSVGLENIQEAIAIVGSGIAVVDFDKRHSLPNFLAIMLITPPGQQTVNRAKLFVLISNLEASGACSPHIPTGAMHSRSPPLGLLSL